MTLYFRSDTRDPKKIFENGFSPKDDQNILWYYHALRFEINKNQRLSIGYAQDALSTYCICMSSKFESTLLFPPSTNYTETYVYLISLPDAIKIQYDEQGQLILDPMRDQSVDIKDLILDLHSLQTEQAAFILDEQQKKTLTYGRLFEHDHNNLKVAWPLYGYEAVAYQVPPERILCAIKCKRENLKLDEHGLYANNNIFLNTLNNQHFIPYDENDKNTADDLLNDIKLKNVIDSPTVPYGLGGKTF